MKKILVALAVVLAFTACRDKQNAAVAGDDTMATVMEGAVTSKGDVAYIQIDTLMSKYALAEELRNTFQNKYNKADRQLNAKYQKLEKDMMNAQDQVQKGLVTRATAAEMEQKLAMQQQELMATRDRMMGELAEEEQVMNNRIYHAVMDYLKEYNADYKYSMIVSTTAMGPILHADPSKDITTEVLTALNERYASNKKSSPAKNETDKKDAVKK